MFLWVLNSHDYFCMITRAYHGLVVVGKRSFHEGSWPALPFIKACKFTLWCYHQVKSHVAILFVCAHVYEC